jgi:copper chaperone CopZ
MAAAPQAKRTGLWAAGASVFSAAAASACCWLPLLFVAFGLSAAGVSAAFAKVRPLFLALCALLLSEGFYFVYFRKATCFSDEACATPNRKHNRFNQAVLWVATAAVGAFAFFPSYSPYLLTSSGTGMSHGAADSLKPVIVKIEGMTCEACAAHVQRALAEVPGVEAASVSYSESKARVLVKPASTPSHDALLKAIEKAGYKAIVPDG